MFSEILAWVRKYFHVWRSCTGSLRRIVIVSTYLNVIILLLGTVLLVVAFLFRPTTTLELIDVRPGTSVTFTADEEWLFVNFGNRKLEEEPKLTYEIVSVSTGQVVSEGEVDVAERVAEPHSTDEIAVPIDESGQYTISINERGPGPGDFYSVLVLTSKFSRRFEAGVVLFLILGGFIIAGLPFINSRARREMDRMDSKVGIWTMVNVMMAFALFAPAMMMLGP